MGMILSPARKCARVIKKFQSEFSGIPVGRLSPGTVEAELTSLDFIKSADVFIDGNNSLNIFVTQREPIMRLLTPEGHSMYIDREGTTMPASLHYSPRVLVAFADVPRDRDTLQLKRPGMEKDLFYLANTIMDDRILNALIEEIIIDDQGQWTMVPNWDLPEFISETWSSWMKRLKHLKNSTRTYYLLKVGTNIRQLI